MQISFRQKSALRKTRGTSYRPVRYTSRYRRSGGRCSRWRRDRYHLNKFHLSSGFTLCVERSWATRGRQVSCPAIEWRPGLSCGRMRPNSRSMTGSPPMGWRCIQSCRPIPMVNLRDRSQLIWPPGAVDSRLRQSGLIRRASQNTSTIPRRAASRSSTRNPSPSRPPSQPGRTRLSRLISRCFAVRRSCCLTRSIPRRCSPSRVSLMWTISDFPGLLGSTFSGQLRSSSLT